MIDTKKLIEECKSHLIDNTTHEQQYKTDIRKLITALVKALSLGDVNNNEVTFCECGDRLMKQVNSTNKNCVNCGATVKAK